MPGCNRMRAIASSSKARRSPRLLPSAMYAATGSGMAFFQVFSGDRENVLVIESEFRRMSEREPADFGRVVAGARLQSVRIEQRHVGDADDAPARIALGIAERAKLNEVLRAHVCFFEQLAPGRSVERLVNLDEPARNGPAALERLVLAANEQHARPGLARHDD